MKLFVGCLLKYKFIKVTIAGRLRSTGSHVSGVIRSVPAYLFQLCDDGNGHQATLEFLIIEVT